MAGAIVLWIGAALDAGVTLSAQMSGKTARYRGRRFDDQQPLGPRTTVRSDDPEAFHDGLVLRWAGVVVLAVFGSVIAVAEQLGYFSN